MALRLPGFTRASSLGPIRTFMGEGGGSIARVLSAVDLPFAILEQRDILVPLREQFRLLDRAARETGDPHFGARLGQVVKSTELSAFGAWVCAAGTLQQATWRAQVGMDTLLQTSTPLTLSVCGPIARWSIEFLEPESEGRHHNEFLALGYMIDVVRVYAGPTWRPNVVMSALPRGTPTRELEEIFGANISHGHAVPAIEFCAPLLENASFAHRFNRQLGAPVPEPSVPRPTDVAAATASVVELALHDGYPRVDWVASKLGTTRRSLQRRLKEEGTTFNRVAEAILLRRAEQLLRESEAPVTDVAFMLGYGDAAHFTRAFRRWTGVSPSQYRQNIP
ncbi:conserved protein of unknown function [Candidatus Filomicrobium marinum]|uniref:HTH araC/xylS-type domain-containing protein n=1 Tax=Candidatus Filomicrobium marinum TaxID=1608628 RepID=A0A0D6JCT5_9HYPH|nr:AraC family transcriptional regulator [Candidatus Filomicrobium marinum]CFX06745.1 conserved protein of unknown function [Candidatus Filomicrobium marinum]CPR16484.1 conserved protein of unknown function [Candidatus Filomicrobium marinum]